MMEFNNTILKCSFSLLFCLLASCRKLETTNGYEYTVKKQKGVSSFAIIRLMHANNYMANSEIQCVTDQSVISNSMILGKTDENGRLFLKIPIKFKAIYVDGILALSANKGFSLDLGEELLLYKRKAK